MWWVPLQLDWTGGQWHKNSTPNKKCPNFFMLRGLKWHTCIIRGYKYGPYKYSLFYLILCLFPEKIKMFRRNDKLHYVTPGTDLIKVGRKAHGAKSDCTTSKGGSIFNKQACVPKIWVQTPPGANYYEPIIKCRVHVWYSTWKRV